MRYSKIFTHINKTKVIKLSLIKIGNIGKNLYIHNHGQEADFKINLLQKKKCRHQTGSNLQAKILPVKDKVQLKATNTVKQTNIFCLIAGKRLVST